MKSRTVISCFLILLSLHPTQSLFSFSLLDIILKYDMIFSFQFFIANMVSFENEKGLYLNLENNSTYILHACHFHSQDYVEISSFRYFITKLVGRDEQFLEYCVKYSVTWTVFLFIINLLVLIFGFVGNALVIGVIVWKPRMRTVTNMFILNLAVADLFVVVFCVPANLVASIFIRKSSS